MTDQEIITAFEKLHHLHSTAGEAVGQFASIGAIRQVIFRPGSIIFVAYERAASETRDAVKLLGDPKATALMDEIVNLTQRMIQFEAALPPARPYIKDVKTGHAGDNATPRSTAPPADELNVAGLALYLGSGTLWNYLAMTVPRPELHVKNLYALSQRQLMGWCKWNESTSDDGIEVLIEEVTRYLATLCVRRDLSRMTNEEILEMENVMSSA